MTSLKNNFLKYKYKNICVIISFFILSFISIILLLHTHSFMGAGDLRFHARRLAELENAFKHYNYFPEFSLNEFHGAADMALYPYLNLFPIIIISFFIKSKILLLYIFFTINILVSLVICYYSSLRYSKSYLISYFFAIIYSMSSLYLDYGFSDMDVGTLSALTFLPLVIFGFIYLLKGYKWIELSIGMSLIVVSHILSVFIITVFLIIWLIFNIRKVNKFIIINLSKAVLLTLLLTSIFWIPFIHVFLLNYSNLNNPGGGLLYGTNLCDEFVGPFVNKLTYSPSIFAIVGLILSLFLFKYFDKIKKQMFILSVITIICCSNLFPWSITKTGIFKLLEQFQFTWRFYIIPQIFLCYLCSYCLVKLSAFIKFHNIRVLMNIFLLLIIVLFQLLSQSNIVNYNLGSPSLTKTYVLNHTSLINSQLHHINFVTENMKLKHSNNKKYPPHYKIDNNKQYKYLIDPYIDKAMALDYFPTRSLPKSNIILRNKAIYNSHFINFNHSGYDKFYMNIKHYRTNHDIILPLVAYNGEHFHIYINNHIAHFHINKNNMIVVHYKYNARDRLLVNIKNCSNVYLNALKLCLFVLGLLWMFYDRLTDSWL